MSDPTCPGCGAEEYVRTDVGKQYECVEYECGSRWWPNAPNRPPLHRNVCFTRQLARRDERNAALEARNKELEEENAELLSKLEQIIAPVEVGGGIEAVLRTMVKELEAELARPKHEVLRQLADAIERIKELEADLVTVVPVVRAAMWYANAEAQRNDAEAVMAMGQIYDCVRDLPAAVLERMGVDR